MDRLHSEQEKPSAKLTTGIVEKAWLRAATDTKSTGGASFEDSFSQQLAEALNALPGDVVQDDIKQLYGAARIYTPAMALASAKTDLDPAVQKSGGLDNYQASALIDSRAGIRFFIPIETPLVDVLKYIAAHTVVKPHIWAAREVTLGSEDRTTPVLVAIWDSGIDLSRFPNQLFTDPHPTASGTHGLAYDEKGNPAKTWLNPLTANQESAYPGFRDEIKGFLGTAGGGALLR